MSAASMADAHDPDDEARQLRINLERILAELFAADPDAIKPVVQAIDMNAVAGIFWKNPAQIVAADVCSYLARTLGSWPMIYRLTEALLRDHFRHPALAAHHRRVCASAYAGPLAASHTMREQAVQDFLLRHFTEAGALRAFDQRGSSTKIEGLIRYEEDELQAAARYFETLDRGLQMARTCTMSANRLDVYSHLLEGAIEYRSCRGLFQLIRLALTTAEFLTAPGAGFFPALSHIRSALLAFLEAGLWPPVAHDVCSEFLDNIPPLASLVIDAGQRRVLQAFTGTLRALVLLEGRGIAETEVLARIDAELPQLEPYLPPRLSALLQYRRCLALVYCGDWSSIRMQLERPPEEWDPNWSGFLWYELGEFESSHVSYECSVQQTERQSVLHAIAIRSLISLLPVTHPSFPPTTLPDDPEAALEATRKVFETARATRTARHAELQAELDDARSHLPAAQSLFDRAAMLNLSSEVHRLTRSTEHTAERVARGRCLAFGGDATAPVVRAYYGFWLCGIPGLGLRSDASGELMQAALRMVPLSHVLEAAHITSAVTEWNPEPLLDAAVQLVQRHGMEAWRNLLAGQLQLLRRCHDELVRQDHFASVKESSDYHPIGVRLAGLVSFFGHTRQILTNPILREIGALGADILRSIGTRTQRFESTVSVCFELMLDACTRFTSTPAQMDLNPTIVAHVLVGRRSIDTELFRGLQPLWRALPEDYRDALVSQLCENASRQPTWTMEGLEELMGPEDGSLASRFVRLLSTPTDMTPLPRDALMREVACHWSTWEEHGFQQPVLPTSPADLSAEQRWSEWRTAILRELADVRLARGAMPSRSWLGRGLYALSALALQFDDVPFWVTMFEQIRPWPLVYFGIGCDLTSVRRELESDRNAGLRRRFSWRLLSAEKGDEWTAVVQVFYFYFRSGHSLLLEDAECLRAFFERTNVRDGAARQLYLCLRWSLERCSDWDADAAAPLRAHVEFMLMHAPRRIQQSGLLPHSLHEVLCELCRTVAACELSRKTAYSEDWVRLQAWLDTHDVPSRRPSADLRSTSPRDDGTHDGGSRA